MRPERFLTLMPSFLRMAVFAGTFLLVLAALFRLTSGEGPQELEGILQGSPSPLHPLQHPLQVIGFTLILLGPISRLILSSLWLFSQRERILGYLPLLSLFFIGMTAWIWSWLGP